MARILIINGSPNENGSCNKVANIIKNKHNNSDIFWIGEQVNGCTNCRKCKRSSYCKYDDKVNEFIKIADNYDGFIFISPVYYGNISNQLDSFLTRIFFSNPKKMMFKPVAGVTVSRRSGNTNAFCRMNMFFLMHSMIVVGSQYWNEIYSDDAGNIEKDKEGIQTIETLIDNMEYVADGIKDKEKPKKQKYIHTNFIR